MANANFPKINSSDTSKYADFYPVKYPKGDQEKPIVAPGGSELGNALPMTPSNKQKEDNK